MKTYPFLLFAMFLMQAGFSQQAPKLFIDSQALWENLGHDNLVVLHVDRQENYDRGHIPGALFIGTDDFAVTRGELYFELPDADYFRKQLLDRGIDDQSRIVISSGWDTFAHAFRLHVTLSYFGLGEQSRIVDGGVRGWQARALPLSTDTATATRSKPGTLTLKPDTSMLVDREWVRDHLDDPDVVLVDARRDAYYQGIEKGRYVRSGHIKHAANLTWTDLVDDQFMLKDEAALRALYSGTGIKEDQLLVAYCHVGLRASVIYTVGKALGYDVRLYDGSYNEWDGLDPDEFPSATTD